LSLLKSRDLGKGFVVIAADSGEFVPELAVLDNFRGPYETETVKASWPGTTTWLLPNFQFPAWVTGVSEQVAARVPAHVQSRELCALFGGSLISTSANPSGYQPARNVLQLRRYFHQPIRRRELYVLPGMLGDAQGPSRIIDAVSGNVVRS
jgi:L-threonylcarbamoyladenylate synthase